MPDLRREAAPQAAAPAATPAPTAKSARYPAELQAMARIDKLLQPFNTAARLRILDWNHSNVTEAIGVELDDKIQAQSPANAVVG